MSILDPEIATAYGALDSVAFADGEAYSAHILRAMIMSSNRLATKGQHLLTMLWPLTDTDDPDVGGATFGMASAKCWPWWARYTLPMTIPKRPGLNRADLRVRAKVTNGYKAYLAVESRRITSTVGTLTLSHPNVLELVGTGAFADYSLDSLLIDESDHDTIAFWTQGIPQFVDGTASYGSPYFGTVTAPSDIVTDMTLVDQGALWNDSLGFPVTQDYANGGHIVQFTDSSDNAIAAPRAILNVTSAVEIVFAPPLESGELARVSAGCKYRFLKVPQITVASVSLAARART